MLAPISKIFLGLVIKLKMQTPTRELIEDMFYVTGYEPITADNQEQVNSIVLKAVA